MAKSYPSNQESAVDPAQYEDLSGSPVVEYPDPEEQARLMSSPEARAQRHAQRLGALPVDFANSPGAPRGKTRPEFEGKDRLPFELPDTIPDETVIRLAKIIQSKGHPLFDKFTDHHRVRPTKENMEHYATKANTKRVEKITPSTTPERIQQLKGRMQRQTQAVLDKMQQSFFVDRNIARRRRSSLKLIRFQIGSGLELDKDAAIHAADAIVDFGYCLQAEQNKEILRAAKDRDLGVKIVHIGEKANEDYEILKQNPLLLRLVQNEQKAKEDYWTPKFNASNRFFGNRLTKAQQRDGSELEAEIRRQTGLIQLGPDVR